VYNEEIILLKLRFYTDFYKMVIIQIKNEVLCIFTCPSSKEKSFFHLEAVKKK